MTQILPSTLSFSDLPSTGRYALYMNARISGSVAYGEGFLQDGWSILAGALGIASNVANAVPAHNAAYNAISSTALPRGFAPMQEFAADQSVYATFIYKEVQGQLLESQIGTMGVFCRANDSQGGWTWENLQSSMQGKVNASCYAALVDFVPSANVIDSPTQIGNGDWSNSLVSATLNDTVGPLGDTDGTRLTELNAVADGNSDQFQTITVIPIVWTASCSFKEGSSGARPMLRVDVLTDQAYSVEFEWVAGAPSVVASSNNLHSFSSIDEGNGWHRVMIRFDLSHLSGTKSTFFQVWPDRNEGAGEFTYVWGAQFAPGLSGEWLATSLRLSLFRYTGGAPTLLETVNFNSASTGQLDSPATIAVSATDNGGNVDLTASVTGFGISSAIELTHTDSSASKVTGQGHAGLIMTPTRVLGGNIVTHVCTVFQVTAGSTIVWRDEWLREQSTNAKEMNWNGSQPLDAATKTGLFQVDGSSLMSAFGWDQHTYDNGVYGAATETYDQAYATGMGPYLQNQTSSLKNVLGFVIHSQPQSYLMLSSRPPNSRYEQRRRLTILQQQLIDNAYFHGIALHASQTRPRTWPVAGSTYDSQECYVAGVRAKTGEDPRWEIRRIRSSSSTTIAQLVDSSYTYHPGFGIPASFELEFTIQNLGDPIGGNPSMVLRVDGVQVPLVSTGESGVSVSASGTVVDGSGFKITEGGEGMYLYYNTGSAADFGKLIGTFDDWTDLTTPGGGPILPENDMASEVFAGEDAFGTATGNLHDVLAPDFPFVETRSSFPIRHEFASGHAAHYARYATDIDTVFERLSWEFSAGARTDTEFQALLDFWDDHDGGNIPFFWTPIAGGDTYTCAFDTDTIDSLMRFLDTRSIAFRVIQVVV